MYIFALRLDRLDMAVSNLLYPWLLVLLAWPFGPLASLCLICGLRLTITANFENIFKPSNVF